MKKLRFIISLLPVCLFFAAGASQAAQVPKVDICHFDEEEGIFKPLAVPGNAVQPHLGHGDVLPDINNEPPLPDLDEECMLIIPPAILAVAYIDVIDDGAGYDPTVDLDIVSVLDSDATPGLSVGDTVEFGAYPTTLNPCPDPLCPNVGEFLTNKKQTITGIDSVFPGYLNFSTSLLRVVELSDAQLRSEIARAQTFSFNTVVYICDDHLGECGFDGTNIGAGLPLSPSSAALDNRNPPLLADEPFLDVEIY